MLAKRQSASVGGEFPASIASARARFVLEGRLYEVFDRTPSRFDHGRIGSLKIDDRHYVVNLATTQPQLLQSDFLDVLSPRELEIAMHIAAGKNAKLVARRLRISFHTVRVHLSRIYAKLGLHKQTELAALIAARVGC